jgi:hypothetical protein
MWVGDLLLSFWVVSSFSFPSTAQSSKDSNDALHERGVEVLDQRPDERHLFAGVVKDDFRIGGVAAEAVGCHHHGQVAGVHFGHRRHFGLRKDLQRERKKMSNWNRRRIEKRTRKNL